MNVLKTFELNGKTAVVTGGAGKYGRFLTEALAEAGATVYIADCLPEEKTKPLTEAFRSRGLDVRAKTFDLGSEDSMRELVEGITAECGCVDVLVNCAVTRCACTGWKIPLETYDRSFHINASALLYLTAIVGDVMKKRGAGSIINIGSFMGLVGIENANYSGTEMGKTPFPVYFYEKGGMTNFTRWAASELGPFGIRVNAIHPGGLMEDTLPEKFVKKYSARTQLGRMATGNDLKGIIVFLASDASSYITGANIPVDGGYTAK